MGFGLNGFWTDSNIYYQYQRLHGWVLDNYHSGYIAIIVETGIIGFILFTVLSFDIFVKINFLMKTVKKH